MSKSRYFLGFFIVLGVVALIGGFWQVGSPFSQRDLQQDDRLVQDLSQVSAQIDQYYREHAVLPERLDQLRGDVPTKDHFTGQPFEFRTTGTTTFELCATFLTASQSGGARPMSYPGSLSTTHGKGFQCLSGSVSLPLVPTK